MKTSWAALIFLFIGMVFGVLIYFSTAHAETLTLCLGYNAITGEDTDCFELPYQEAKPGQIFDGKKWVDDPNAVKDPEYELTFTIKYNSIPADQIRNLIYKIMLEHQKACDVDVKIKKGSQYLTWESGSLTLPSPNVIYTPNSQLKGD